MPYDKEFPEIILRVENFLRSTFFEWKTGVFLWCGYLKGKGAVIKNN